MPAKTGNTNALKHGLYAKHFKSGEIATVGKIETLDLVQEIAMLRVVLSRILEQQEKADKDEAKAMLWSSFANAVIALNTTIRTHALLSGSDAGVLTALEEALKQFHTKEGF